MIKKAKSKIPNQAKGTLQVGFMDIIPSTAPKRLKSATPFSNSLLIVSAYSKIPKLYCMEKNTTEKVMNKPNMFQYRFGRIDEFGLLDLERVWADAGTQCTSTEFKQ